MTSKERRELRYLRRKKKREDKIIERSNMYADIDSSFTFSKVLKYADKCCNGVRWKKSTQIFQLHMFTNVACTCYNIKNNNYKVGNTYQFIINERGKERLIDAPHIKDRLIHKVINNEILLPIYSPLLIYDNGASAKDKGFLFTLNRVKKKLLKNYKLNNDGYVVLMDYSKFFENCSHDVIMNLHKKYIKNEYTIKVIEDYLFIGKGIALGVEIAQREASMIPSGLDHYLQNEKLSSIRYMDDIVFFCENYDMACVILNKYIEMSNKLNIVINRKKTKIIKLSNWFMYCKWKFKIYDNGKIVMVPNKKTIYRQRRKLRKMIKKNVNKEDIDIVKNSFKAYLNMGNSYSSIKYLNSIYFGK